MNTTVESWCIPKSASRWRTRCRRQHWSWKPNTITDLPRRRRQKGEIPFLLQKWAPILWRDSWTIRHRQWDAWLWLHMQVVEHRVLPGEHVIVLLGGNGHPWLPMIRFTCDTRVHGVYKGRASTKQTHHVFASFEHKKHSNLSGSCKIVFLRYFTGEKWWLTFFFAFSPWIW